MSHTSPDKALAPSGDRAGTGGRAAPLTSWVLYALTLPSGGLSAIIGVIIAYLGRTTAAPLVRAHIDAQIRLFWSGFIWAALFTLAWGLSLWLTTLYVGIPMLFLFCAALLLLGVWFTIRSVLGARALIGGRAP